MWVMASGQQITTETIVGHIRCPLITEFIFHDRDDVLGEAALTEQENGVLLYHIFKDADALDRFRLGPNGLDIRYLRTAEGKSFYRYAEQFERGDANA